MEGKFYTGGQHNVSKKLTDFQKSDDVRECEKCQNPQLRYITEGAMHSSAECGPYGLDPCEGGGRALIARGFIVGYCRLVRLITSQAKK